MQAMKEHNNPIQPMLASDLLSAAKTTRTKREKTRTNCTAIDQALEGGVESGQAGLVAVTGDKGSGRTALAFALISSHLLSSPTAHATLIDTAGTFDVGRLYATILSQLRKQRRLAKAQLRNQTATTTLAPPQQRQLHLAANSTGDEGEEEEAARILDRIDHARVFDFVGVVDAVAEVRERLEAKTQRKEAEKMSEETDSTKEDVQVARKGAEGRGGLKRIRSNVSHIDDTDDEVDDDEDADATIMRATREKAELATKDQNEGAPTALEGTERRGMIILDCISHIVGPMMKTNHIQTSAILSSFLRSLNHLTASHNLTTVLVNGAFTWDAARPMMSPVVHHSQPPSRGPTYTSSVFSSSSHVIPALSPMLAGHVDLHLLLTVQPLSHGDAVTLNLAAGAPPFAGQRPRAGKRANLVGVLEVISDRYGDRVGRWGPFIVDAKGIIADIDEDGKREER